jgi:RimJ/RimL family protein N-acetyltransferase
MTEPLQIVGRRVALRLVRPEDAEFILSLRLNTERNRYLSTTDPDVEAQVEWLVQYQEREKQGLEYYFVVEELGAGPSGACRFYDPQGPSFHIGSWVHRPGASFAVALEGIVRLYDVGFQYLGCRYLRFQIMKANTRVIASQLRLGGVEVGEDATYRYFRMDQSSFERQRARFARHLGVA